MLLPAIQAAREAARRSQCTNNLKQLAIGSQNFHDIYKRFPVASFEMNFRVQNSTNPADFTGNRNRWSYLVSLLPFCERQPLYDDFLNNHLAKTTPWDNTSVTTSKIPTFLCPSDGQANSVADGQRQPTSYHCNRGDYRLNWDWNECRGVFGQGAQQFKTVASVTDGLANTMAIGEVKCGVSGSTKIGQALATGWGFTNGAAPAPCLARQQADGTVSGSVSGWDGTMGSRWADSVAVYTHWHVILGPNAPSCSNGSEDWGMITASSYHPGGVNVALCDASVRFITNSIDAGDPNVGESSLPGSPNQGYTGPSLRGVWGALGTVSGGETVQSQDR
ncbi:MAG: DUF1559 domain-containing protein [Planctomycetota bacterium]|nr:DUF1559 domain-containing protein [Planctomycetota bacterium]